jgi:hypothetical protein
LSIIGYSILLSVPSRRDKIHLNSLFSDHGLCLREPTISEVLGVCQRNLHRFSGSFVKLFIEFVADQERLSTTALSMTAFWQCVRDAAFTACANIPSKTPRYRVELDDDDGRFWLFMTTDQEAEGTRIMTTPLPISRTSRFRFGVIDPSSSASDGILDTVFSNQEGIPGIEPILLPARLAAEGGLLLFAEDEDGAFSLVSANPASGRLQLLVHERLISMFLEALGRGKAIVSVRHSNYSGWNECRGVTAEGLAGVEWDSLSGFASLPCLRRTLPPPHIYVRSGVRAGDSYLSVAGLLPSFEAPGADRMVLDKADGTKATLCYEASTKLWQFPGSESTTRLIGRHRIVAYADGAHIADRHIGFVAGVANADYKKPTDKSRWIVESGVNPTMPLGQERDFTEVEPNSFNFLGSSAATVNNSTAYGSDREAIYTLVDVLAAQSASQSGISEGELIAVASTLLGLDRAERWAVIRAWLETGALDCFIDLRWRARRYFARHPQIVAYESQGQIVGVLVGLIPGILRRRFQQMAEILRMPILHRGSASVHVPTMLGVLPGSVANLMTLSRETAVPVSWLASPSSVVRSVQEITSSFPPEPTNSPMFKLWDWEFRSFVDRPRKIETNGISVDWCRRDDAPDCYKVRRDEKVVWWTRSRTWAILGAFSLAEIPLFEVRAGGIAISYGDSAYLPLTLARLVAITGPIAPGPTRSEQGALVYQYTFGSDNACRSAFNLLWRHREGQNRPSKKVVPPSIMLARKASGQSSIPLPALLRQKLDSILDPNELRVSRIVNTETLSQLYAMMRRHERGES